MSHTPNPITRLPAPVATETPLPWGWREVVKALLFMIVGILVVGLLVIGIGMATGDLPLAEGEGMAAGPLFWLGVLIYGVVALAVYLFAVRRAQGDWSQLGFAAFGWNWLFLAPVITLGMLFGMGVVNVVLVMPFTGGEFENPQIEALTGGGSSLSRSELGALLILVAIIAPIVEELFFRGMLYPVLRRRWSPTTAIIVNGFLFALIHVMPILLPGLFLVGMVLAWVRERSGSVIPCIVIHALQNGTVLFVLYATLNGLAGPTSGY